jgi:hypothetical protein
MFADFRKKDAAMARQPTKTVARRCMHMCILYCMSDTSRFFCFGDLDFLKAWQVHIIIGSERRKKNKKSQCLCMCVCVVKKGFCLDLKLYKK